TGSLRTVQGSPRRLEALGLGASQLRSPREVAELATVGDPAATAVALVMHHPNVATIDRTSAGVTSSLLHETPDVQSLGSYIQTMQNEGRDFAKLVPATDPDGSPSHIQM